MKDPNKKKIKLDVTVSPANLEFLDSLVAAEEVRSRSAAVDSYISEKRKARSRRQTER